ncbi:hypothetical protein TcasGA2_TC005950 [Tribolium castaneum]|uniref:Uncharacterized protein n=1 Tax=Tribolium castaneum TaxID=7070 RepID=D6WVD8_TRICA|nr:hypothetical protein TcasGA2_TC005950 [Tribolium castaneum]
MSTDSIWPVKDTRKVPSDIVGAVCIVVAMVTYVIYIIKENGKLGFGKCFLTRSSK